MGPLAIDMYLPALPTIGREFGADAAAVQVSLAAYFAGMAIGQAFYGPLSDAVGRKPALLFGLAVFVVSSIGVCVGRERPRAGRVPLSAGSRRLRADRHSACGGPRLFRSGRIDPDAVDADAGDGPRANSRPAHRRATADQLRMAIGVLGAGHLRDRLAHSRRRVPARKLAGVAAPPSADWCRARRVRAAGSRPHLHRIRAVGRTDVCRACWPTFRGHPSCSSNCFMCRPNATDCSSV